MISLVLEKSHELSLRTIALPDTVGPHDVRIKIHTVGTCGSDVHYYQHGGIGPFVVRAPLVLGHEASGTVVEVGDAVTTLREGDRVCMEPGIPDPDSKATRLGLYNYAHVYPRAIELMSSGRIDVTPLLTNHYDFERSIEAFDDATRMRPESVKMQITLPQ